MGRRAEMGWSIATLLIAIVGAGAGLMLALILRWLDVWPPWDLAEYLFGAVCGAIAVHRWYPSRPIVTFLVFVPVLTALLLIVTLLVHIYVLGNTPEF